MALTYEAATGKIGVAGTSAGQTGRGGGADGGAFDGMQRPRGEGGGDREWGDGAFEDKVAPLGVTVRKGKASSGLPCKGRLTTSKAGIVGGGRKSRVGSGRGR